MSKRPAVCAAALAAVLAFAAAAGAQEKFIDVRQAMADALTRAKTDAAKGDWPAAAGALVSGREIWARDVQPLIREGVKTSADYKEYADRIGEVEASLEAAGKAVFGQDAAGLETKINAAIWGISHHPRGFDVPPPRYTTWDWVFGLSIGIGFCLFAVWFGLYLRRSYYSRYPKAVFVRKGRKKA